MKTAFFEEQGRLLRSRVHRMFRETVPGKETIDQVLEMYPLRSLMMDIHI